MLVRFSSHFARTRGAIPSKDYVKVKERREKVFSSVYKPNPKVKLFTSEHKIDLPFDTIDTSATAHMLEKVSPNVVRLYARYNKSGSKYVEYLGSGVWFKNKILTCYHNVEEHVFEGVDRLKLSKILFTPSSAAQSPRLARPIYTATLKTSLQDMKTQFPNADFPMVGAKDKRPWGDYDFAVLEASETAPLDLSIASDSYLTKLKIGDPCYVLGYPAGLTYEDWASDVAAYGGAKGKEISKEQYDYVMELFGYGDRKVASEGTIAAVPVPNENSVIPHITDTMGGFSGGPVFDSAGTLIGIHLGFIGSVNVFLPVSAPLFTWAMKTSLFNK